MFCNDKFNKFHRADDEVLNDARAVFPSIYVVFPPKFLHMAQTRILLNYLYKTNFPPVMFWQILTSRDHKLLNDIQFDQVTANILDIISIQK